MPAMVPGYMHAAITISNLRKELVLGPVVVYVIAAAVRFKRAGQM